MNDEGVANSCFRAERAATYLPHYRGHKLAPTMEWGSVKPREVRRNVMIPAFLHNGNAWCDANIINVSLRGLSLYTTNPPPAGAYVEVRRGTDVIVGRVVWANAGRFGVRTQDPLAIDSLVGNVAPKCSSRSNWDERPSKRRAEPRAERLEWRHAQSREKGRALQFVSVAVLGLILAACAYQAVSEALSRPLSEVVMQLGAEH